jgi:hypothetical protein
MKNGTVAKQAAFDLPARQLAGSTFDGITISVAKAPLRVEPSVNNIKKGYDLRDARHAGDPAGSLDPRPSGFKSYSNNEYDHLQFPNCQELSNFGKNASQPLHPFVLYVRKLREQFPDVDTGGLDRLLK